MRRTARATRTAAAAAVAALAVSTAASCSNGGSNPGVSTTNAADTIKANYALTGVVNPSTHKGGTLILGGTQDMDSIDPVNQYYAYAWSFSRYYARTLMTYKVGAPGSPSIQLVPGLAATAPSASADGKTWTVNIRSGLKFSNGEDITSKDVKYAIERSYAIDSPLISSVLARGDSTVSPAEQFRADLLAEMIRGYPGVDESQIAAEFPGQPTERGPQNWKWVLAMLRVLDRILGTRTSVYGWAFYFGDVSEEIEAAPWTNVCVSCGAGHSSTSLRVGNMIKSTFLLFKSYNCPNCGAWNLFTEDASHA